MEVPERLYGVLDLAPEGSRLAVQVADVNDYIWIYDFRRQEGRKLPTRNTAGWPVWTPDGKVVSFISWRPPEQSRKIHWQRVDTPGVEEEIRSLQPMGMVESWSPDGRVLAFSEWSDRAKVGFHSVEGSGQYEWLDREGSNSWCVDFSPDGHWIAYSSDKTGRYEIWLQSFPSGDVVRQLSVYGGAEPVWCRESGELFFRRSYQWFATQVTLHPELSWEPPRLVFETDFIDTPGRSYDVTPDGQRLLVVKRTQKPTRTTLHVVHNWFEELKRLVPSEH
jgi:Tol biopolymer transport system component